MYGSPGALPEHTGLSEWMDSTGVARDWHGGGGNLASPFANRSKKGETHMQHALGRQLLTIGILVVAAAMAHGQNYPADNSGRNQGDTRPNVVTAGQQSNDPTDMAISQKIRKSVVADRSLSTNAHNVKIITVNGIVTLRGPVRSKREKLIIVAKAERVAGVSRVDNQLE